MYHFFYLAMQAIMMRRKKVDWRMVVDRRGKTVMDRVTDRVKMVKKVMDRNLEKRTNVMDRVKVASMTNRVKVVSVTDRVKVVEKRTNVMDRVKVASMTNRVKVVSVTDRVKMVEKRTNVTDRKKSR